MHKILIVEDDQSTRTLMSSFLTKAGYKVVAVENGKKAIITLRKHRVDILLIDLIMPEMDGLRLLELIRSNIITQDIPAILCSSVIEQNKILKAVSLGITEYVLKPFTKQSLLEKVDKVADTIPIEVEELDKSNEESAVQVVETKAAKSKPEVRPSANPETSGWDELDKSNEEPAVQVVETKAPKSKPEVRPSANPEASGWDELDKSNTQEPPGTNQMKQAGLATSPNFLPAIVETMKKALIIAGKKLEAGEFNDFEKLIRQLSSYSENTANPTLEVFASELAEVIENASAQRRSSLLAMRSKIHLLNQFIEKNCG